MLPEKYRAKYSEFVESWEKAEEVLKKVERIKNEAFLPSINELRYAGRRIVQAHSEHKNVLKSEVGEGLMTCGLTDHVDTHITEAIENCRKARHDAIDSAINFVHERLDTIVDSFGIVLVNQSFPEYRKLRGLMRDMDRKIVESRRGRTQMDDMYEEIKREHLDKMVELYCSLEDSDEVLRKIISTNRKEFLYTAVLTGVIVGLVCGLFLLFLDKNNILDFMKI